jgi:hypothetical protein
MKNLQPRSGKQIDQLIARILLILVTIGFFGSAAYSQITSTNPASRCGEGTVVLSATASSGTIKWYDVPFYGTPVGTGATFTTPALAVTKTYYVDAVDGSNCSLNSGSARVQVIATISASSIQAIIFYDSNTFCKSVVGAQTITRTGTAGGTYTVSPLTGLTLDASTGSITPSSSTTGTYTVTYTVTAAAGCTENPASTDVTITTVPVAPVISYAGTPFCTTAGTENVTQTGAAGGNYSAAPSGLTINPATGAITPATSSTGTYTITYFVPGSGGCSFQRTTTSVLVLQLPTATISYAEPFTKNQGGQPVTLSGTGVYTGGIYTATPSGLTIDASTGAITPSTSTAGIYSITYTLNAVAPCAQVTATTNVTIFPLPTAIINGTQSVCQNSAAPNVTFTGAGGTSPYTFTYNIGSGSNQTITTTSGNSVTVSQPTPVAGTYTFNLISVSDANSSSQIQSGTAAITVTSLPVATFNYAATPYCSDGSNPLPTFLEGGIAGTFSSTSGLVFVSSSTGQISLSGSTPGTYTVTNRIAAAGGCPIVEPISSVTINKLPVATFHYSGNSYCQSGTNPAVLFDGAGVAGLFTSIPAGVRFVAGFPGTIDLAASTPGNYQIVNTIIAANGCGEVITTFDNLAIVAPPSYPSISYSGSPYCNSITQAQPVELTGTGGGTFTYAVVSGGPSLSISALGAITPGTSNPGTYTVTYSIGGGSGCTPATGTATVIINQTPAVTNVNAVAICSGTSPNIILTSSIPSTFSWTLGIVPEIILDASVSSGNQASINQVLNNVSYTDAGTVPYIVTPVSTDNSCAGAPYTINVTVNPQPQLVINESPAVCSPATVDITASSITAGSTTGLTFTYWTDIAATVSLTNPATVSASDNYYIKGTNPSGCFTIREVIVTINPLPGVVITNPAAICSPGTVDLTSGAVTSGSTTGLTFTYWTDSEATSSLSTPSAVDASGTYYIKGTTPEGCSSISPVTVTINALPVAGAITGETAVCMGGTLSLSSNATGTGTLTYTWASSNTGVATVNSTGVVTPVSAGSANITYTVTDGSATHCPATSAIFTITVTDLPLAPTGLATQTFCSGN